MRQISEYAAVALIIAGGALAGIAAGFGLALVFVTGSIAGVALIAPGFVIAVSLCYAASHYVR